MARVKRAVGARKKRRKVMERASGYTGARSRRYRTAREQTMYRLIYKSRANQRIDWEFVNGIVATSEDSNKDTGITGILLATDSHFLQVLEGGFDEVNDLFVRIVRDPRHDNIRLIAFDCVDSRLFGGWTMHGIGIFNFNRSLIADLIEQYGEEEGSVKFPVEDWKTLALISDLRRA